MHKVTIIIITLFLMFAISNETIYAQNYNNNQPAFGSPNHNYGQNKYQNQKDYQQNYNQNNQYDQYNPNYAEPNYRQPGSDYARPEHRHHGSHHARPERIDTTDHIMHAQSA